MAPTPDIALRFYTLIRCSDLQLSTPKLPLIFQFHSYSTNLWSSLIHLFCSLVLANTCYCFLIHTDLFFVLWSLTLRPVNCPLVLILPTWIAPISHSRTWNWSLSSPNFTPTEDCFLNPDTQSHTWDYFYLCYCSMIHISLLGAKSG